MAQALLREAASKNWTHYCRVSLGTEASCRQVYRDALIADLDPEFTGPWEEFQKALREGGRLHEAAQVEDAKGNNAYRRAEAARDDRRIAHDRIPMCYGEDGSPLRDQGGRLVRETSFVPDNGLHEEFYARLLKAADLAEGPVSQLVAAKDMDPAAFAAANEVDEQTAVATLRQFDRCWREAGEMATYRVWNTLRSFKGHEVPGGE